jgi:hypothetical protein
MPKKVAKDNDENVDYGPYDMDDSEEEEAGQNITPKTAAKTTTKTKNSAQKAAEKEAEDKKREMRAAIDAKMAAVLTLEEMEFRAQEEADKEKALAKKLRGPQTSSKTHQTNLDEAKVAIEETKKYIKTKHDGKYYELHLLMLYCDEWKQVPPHADEEFKKFTTWLTKQKEALGLTKKNVGVTPSPAGSKTVSRAASVAPVDESIEEEEEEAEETK